MTKEQILKKAIEKAKENGWINIKYDDKIICGCHPERYCSIIFSHDFAKAFWGEDMLLISNKHGPVEEAYFDSYHDYREEAWRYYSQELVLEEEPLKYLEQFL